MKISECLLEAYWTNETVRPLEAELNEDQMIGYVFIQPFGEVVLKNWQEYLPPFKSFFSKHTITVSGEVIFEKNKYLLEVEKIKIH